MIDLGSIITITREIVNIFQSRLKTSPLQASLKHDCDKILSTRQAEQETKFLELRNNYASQHGLQSSQANDFLGQLGDTIEPVTDHNPHLDSQTSDLQLKIRAFLELFDQQIKDYNKSGTLHPQLIQQKNKLIAQLTQDSDQMMQLFLLQSREQIQSTTSVSSEKNEEMIDLINDDNNKFIKKIISTAITNIDTLLISLITTISPE